MNGRVFDPRIGRFVSADPLVSNPGFSQSYNRYAYVFGSPMSFTDPSGYDPNPPEVKLNARNAGIEIVTSVGQMASQITPGAVLFSVEGSFGGMTQIAWFSASSAGALVGQHVTFDFEGTKITREIREEDVEASKIRKGEIVRAILSVRCISSDLRAGGLSWGLFAAPTVERIRLFCRPATRLRGPAG